MRRSMLRSPRRPPSRTARGNAALHTLTSAAGTTCADGGGRLPPGPFGGVADLVAVVVHGQGAPKRHGITKPDAAPATPSTKEPMAAPSAGPNMPTRSRMSTHHHGQQGLFLTRACVILCWVTKQTSRIARYAIPQVARCDYPYLGGARPLKRLRVWESGQAEARERPPVGELARHLPAGRSRRAGGGGSRGGGGRGPGLALPRGGRDDAPPARDEGRPGRPLRGSDARRGGRAEGGRGAVTAAPGSWGGQRLSLGGYVTGPGAITPGHGPPQEPTAPRTLATFSWVERADPGERHAMRDTPPPSTVCSAGVLSASAGMLRSRGCLVA